MTLPTIAQVIDKAILTLIVGGAGSLLMFPIRSLVRRVRAEWSETKDALLRVQAELEVQRTNCLTTLQVQSAEQIRLTKQQGDVFERMAGSLDRLASDQEATVRSNDKIVDKLDDLVKESARTAGLLEGMR